MEYFSDREEKVIKIIGRKKIRLVEITEELFKDEGKPLDATVKVAGAVNRIMRKCEYYKLNWKLVKIREYSKLYVKKERV